MGQITLTSSLGAPYGDILGYRRLDEEATGFTGSLKPFFDSYCCENHFVKQVLSDALRCSRVTILCIFILDIDDFCAPHWGHMECRQPLCSVRQCLGLT